MTIDFADVTFRHQHGTFEMNVDRLTVAGGERAVMVGPSGSGKTTLLHLVAGIIQPHEGRITVGGRPVSELNDVERRTFRITRMGLVFHEFELLEYLNVLDNILLPCRISQSLRLSGEVRDRAGMLAGDLGIGDKLTRFPDRLSQGERQRVAVCRALINQPDVVLADEPTGSLDPENRDRVLGYLLEESTRSGATLIVTTHDYELLDRFDRTIDLRELCLNDPQGTNC